MESTSCVPFSDILAYVNRELWYIFYNVLDVETFISVLLVLQCGLPYDLCIKYFPPRSIEKHMFSNINVYKLIRNHDLAGTDKTDRFRLFINANHISPTDYRQIQNRGSGRTDIENVRLQYTQVCTRHSRPFYKRRLSASDSTVPTLWTFASGQLQELQNDSVQAYD